MIQLRNVSKIYRGETFETYIVFENIGMPLFVMVTHNEKIAAYADRIVTVSDGKICSK